MAKEILDDYLKEKIDEMLKDEKEFLTLEEYEESFNYELSKLKDRTDMSLNEFKNTLRDALFEQMSSENFTLRKKGKIKIKKD